MTRRVISYAERVSRWQPNPRARLERAALELFLEQGYGATTVPEITARAELTTRTFFRHFPDKREVLFSLEEELPSVVRSTMSDAPADATPMEVIAHALDIVATTRLSEHRDYLRVRRSVVNSDDGLREREMRKNSVLVDAATAGFRERGLGELEATVSAQIAITVFTVAVDRWLDDPRPLTEHLAEAIASVRGSTR